MKIIVTGGAGFIGSNFIYYFIDQHPDDQIICVDSLTYAGNLSTLNQAMECPMFQFKKLDITNRAGIMDFVKEERPNAIVNFAAESHVDRSIDNPGIFLATNIIGTQILMDAARAFGDIRFHQVSTDEVYGDLPLERKDLFFTEKNPLCASSPYSASKASADLLVQAYHRTYGLPVTISRCSNNYGPYQFPEKLIPLVIENALQNKSLPVYGTGENVRDWLHVSDHCAAIDLILRNGTIGEIYNIGGHNERTNLEVIQVILDVLGKDRSLISFVKDRKGHDQRYAIDPTKIEKELGWFSSISFDEGIRPTIQWYLDHESWRKEIISGEYLSYYEKKYQN